MKILAVDTSGLQSSIALSDDRVVLAEHTPSAVGRRHAQTLVSDIDRLLQSQQLSPRDIDAVAVSIGPGSFTGLRVGVVFAKTFAWANDARLVAVDTLQAIAQQIGEQHEAVTVISDAQRQEVFVNEYTWDRATQARVTVGEIRIERVAAIAGQDLTDSAQRSVSLLTGPGLMKFAAEFPEHICLAGESFWQPRAATVAEIGSLMLNRGQVSDVDSLEPLYIRRSYAEEKAHNS